MAVSKPPRDATARGRSGRFSEPVAERVRRYTASVDFDRRLAEVDIEGSLAHARMLAGVRVLSADDLAAIERGMETIRGEIARGEFAWSRDLEDVHLNIEDRLTALIGDAGKRLHTARSRNDQVATDLRLWLRGAIDEFVEATSSRCAARCSISRSACGHDHAGLYAPAGRAAGHLRPPSARVRRNARARRRALLRLPPARQPAAARRAALAGTSYPIDREHVAQGARFRRTCARIRSTPCPIAISRSNSRPRPRS